MPLLPSARDLPESPLSDQRAPDRAGPARSVSGVPALSLLILLALLAGVVALLLCAAWGAAWGTAPVGRPAGVGPHAAAAAQDRRAAAGRVAAALCFGGLLLDGLFFLGGAQAAALPLPVGLPGSGATLALDPLSGLSLLPLLLVGAAVFLAAPDAACPALLAAAVLVVLAGDGFSLVAGAGAVTLAGWGALLAASREPAGRRRAVLLWLGTGAGGTVCLLAATGLLLPPGGLLPGLGFPVLRALAAPGWRADAAMLLTLLAACAFGALPPLDGWLPAACRQLPPSRAALLAGVAGVLGPYLAARVLLDLAGPATPGWWGLPLIVTGVSAVVGGALQALLARETRGVGTGAAIAGTGMALLAIGLALLARGADLPVLAALALAGGLLAVLVGAPTQALLLLAAGAIESGAGTRRLDRLGGLMHRMPVTAACVMLAGATLASLPPSGGFALAWLVLQALLAAPRIGGLPLQLLLVAATAGLGLGLGLLGLAALRLVAAALLGRPRSPRGAAADEAPVGLRRVLVGLAAVSALLGVLPGAALALADPALRLLAGAGLEGRSGLWSLAPQRDAPGYAPLVVALLLGLLGLGARALLRLRLLRGEARVPAWEDGFAPPPPWLPFGDPLTQLGAAALADAPLRVLGLPESPGHPRRWRNPLAHALHPSALRLCRRLTRLAARATAPSATTSLRLLAASLVALLLWVVLWHG